MNTKRADKQSRILDVATALFSERGYTATRMQDIADGLAMKAGSLYYYFESKEAVLAAIVGERVGLAVSMLERIVEGPGDSLDRIRSAIAGHLDVFDRHADLYRIFQSERLEAISEELGARVDELGRRYEELWVKLIERAQADGSVRPDADPWVLMKGIVGMCNSTLFWFTPEGRYCSSEVAETFADMILAGIAIDG
jgi:AcrR family transcriptional regulator